MTSFARTSAAIFVTTTSNGSMWEDATWTTALAPEDVETFLEEESRKAFIKQLPTVLFIVFLSMLGLLGNSVTALIYYRRYRPSSTRTYILAMAGCDLLTNVWSLPTEALDFRYTYTYTSNAACKIFSAGLTVLVQVTVLLLVAVALDRHILICRRPSLARSYGQKAGKVVVVCVVFAVLLSVPQAIIMKTNSVPFPGYNVTGSKCFSKITTPTEKVVRLVHNIILYTGFLGCVLSITVCYSTIAYRLWKHAKHMRKNSQSLTDSSEERTQKSTTDNPADHMGSSGLGEAVALHPMRAPKHPDAEDRVAQEGQSETEATCHDQSSQAMGQACSALPQAQAPCQEGQPLNADSAKSQRGAASHVTCGAASHVTCGAASHVTCGAASHASSPAPAQGPSWSPARAEGGVKKIPSRTTLMLFVLTVVFVLSYLPLLSARLLHLSDPASEDPNNLVEIMLRSFYLNGAINPLIYSFCSAKFRLECRHLMRSLCRR